MIQLETERLILRDWRGHDIEPFCNLNADARVMKYFPSIPTADETRAMIKRFEKSADDDGFSFQPVIEKKSGNLIGMVGLSVVAAPLHFAPAIEIGWRLSVKHWGRGYATEAALEFIRYGFETLNLKEIISFTPVTNQPSRAVMERIGMEREGDGDFDHPKLPTEHELCRHVLYRIKAPQR